MHFQLQTCKRKHSSHFDIEWLSHTENGRKKKWERESAWINLIQCICRSIRSNLFYIFVEFGWFICWARQLKNKCAMQIVESIWKQFGFDNLFPIVCCTYRLILRSGFIMQSKAITIYTHTYRIEKRKISIKIV